MINQTKMSNERVLSYARDVASGSTDIMPQGLDLRNILNWRQNAPLPQLTGPFREARSIRIICCDPSHIRNALQSFDAVVNDIENCVLSEMRGNSITSSWQPNPDQRTCTACDFKTFCPNPAPRPYRPTVP